MRRLLVVLGLLAAAGSAAGQQAPAADHHFRDLPLARLVLVTTGSNLKGAVVEAEDGSSALVRVGDLVGQEGHRVVSVTRGCLHLWVEASGTAAAFCVDIPQVPRS